MKKIICLALAFFAAAEASGGAFAKYDSKTYLYGGTTAIYISRMERTGKSIDTVCPDYFEISATGELKYSKAVDPLLLSTMKSRDVTVTPFFSNHWSRELARLMLSKRALVAQQLADAVKTHGLDGLDIDIQNINEADKDAFTDFIRLLRAALPQGKLLTVCVPANPYYATVGWQGGYNYAALNNYCDHIFIMTYDESYPGGPPGPVASYWFIEKSIQYGLQYVPAKKLMVGIPFYGRYWTKAVSGEAFTISDIERIVASAPSAVWYDEAKDCARATVTVGAGDNVTTWGGKKLAAGTYDIWYENARSFKTKLALVRKYGILGVGSWALGQEPAWVWDSYLAWLDGSVYVDIEKHWAQSYILDLTERGLLKGVDDTHFAPEANLTRAEAAALMVRLAGREDMDAVSPFEDTKGHWAEKYIAIAAKVGLVTGETPTQFMPDRRMTREEIAVIADRYLNIEDTFDVMEHMYSDVSAEKNSWSIRAILKLTQHNVLSGYSDGTFRPKNPVTRAETAKLVSLLLDLPTRFLKNEILPQEKEHMGPR